MNAKNKSHILSGVVLYHLHLEFSQLKCVFCALTSIEKITVSPATPMF